jgi:hypothetical protein
MPTKDERVILEEDQVRYHSGLKSLEQSMLGKLMLSNKRLMFLQEEVVEEPGLFHRKRDLDVVGLKLDLPVDKIVSTSTDTRQRKRGTWDARPTLLSDETYKVLILSLQTENGIENPVFEVATPDSWVSAIQSVAGVIPL